MSKIPKPQPDVMRRIETAQQYALDALASGDQEMIATAVHELIGMLNHWRGNADAAQVQKREIAAKMRERWVAEVEPLKAEVEHLERKLETIHALHGAEHAWWMAKKQATLDWLADHQGEHAELIANARSFASGCNPDTRLELRLAQALEDMRTQMEAGWRP